MCLCVAAVAALKVGEQAEGGGAAASYRVCCGFACGVCISQCSQLSLSCSMWWCACVAAYGHVAWSLCAEDHAQCVVSAHPCQVLKAAAAMPHTALLSGVCMGCRCYVLGQHMKLVLVAQQTAAACPYQGTAAGGSTKSAGGCSEATTCEACTQHGRLKRVWYTLYGTQQYNIQGATAHVCHIHVCVRVHTGSHSSRRSRGARAVVLH